ncbi:MAG: LacI family transcriptional regulator [Lentisphaerae bacterium]|nr:LacI family transcriptional regulator [Lentisphaerota bacterium]
MIFYSILSQTVEEPFFMTIKDIARHFNTSVSVVSRALNDTGYVSSDKRNAIKEYALQHHYQPSHVAQQLKRSRRDMIGIIMPWVLRNQMNFVPMLLNMLHTSQKEWHMVIGNNESSVAQLATMPVGKIIAVNITSEQYPAIRRAAGQGIEILNVMGFCQDIPSIRFTHEKVMYDCMKQLTGAGHRRIAYVGMDLERPQTNLHRYYLKMARQGLLQAAAENQISMRKAENMIYADSNYDLDRSAIETMIKNYRPTAIIVWPEQAESMIYNICHKLQLRIPDDISLIGLGGNDMLNGFYPQLTHYRFDYQAILEVIKEFIALAPGEYSGHRELDFKFYPGESIKTI